MPVVTLLTDFGMRDGYVGAMKGVVLSRAPAAQLVDLAHDIEPQEVRSGAWAVRQAAPLFPPGTIHVGVVDPGVGTTRRALLFSSGGQLFVGPDNGLFAWVLRPDAQAWVLDRAELFRPEPSKTFHGRDLFASVAGHLAAGLSVERAGTPIDAWVPLLDPAARRDGSLVLGEVVHVDRFGNLISNIDREVLGPVVDWTVTIAGRRVGAIEETFASVGEGEWVAYFGSTGLLEIALRNASAASRGHGVGTAIVCRQR